MKSDFYADKEEIARRADGDFQRGHGKAQVRDKYGNLVHSFSVRKEAMNVVCVEEGETVWWRAKVRGRYEWQMCAGTLSSR